MPVLSVPEFRATGILEPEYLLIQKTVGEETVYGRIVICCLPEYLRCQVLAGLVGQFAVGPQFVQHESIICGIGDRTHIPVILAALLSMVGPPMSIFSMASAMVTSGLAMVFSNG